MHRDYCPSHLSTDPANKDKRRTKGCALDNLYFRGIGGGSNSLHYNHGALRIPNH